jgi:redox-sensing transcriptional repressor
MKEKTDSKSRRARPSPAPAAAAAGAGLSSPPGKSPVASPPADAENSHKAGASCVRRLPSYLQLLRVLQAEGREHVSGTVLASVHNLEPVIVRKDLATTGITGTPRIGFRVTELIAAIEHFLGWDNETKAILVGTGNLGSALLGYRGFENFGLHIIAAFDRDPKKIGQWVHGYKVQSINQLTGFGRSSRVLLGVLAVPAEAAQPAADRMIAAGIRGIWNFTPVKLQVPGNVVTEKEDLAEGLALLSHRMQHLSRPAPLF